MPDGMVWAEKGRNREAFCGPEIQGAAAMETIWQGLLIFGLVLMAGYGINLWLIWDKLRDEEAAVREHCYPWSYGYAHYLAAKKRYSFWCIFPVLALCVVLCVLFYADVPIPAGEALPFLGILICGISAGYLLITFSASVIETGIIDARALRAFQLTSLEAWTMLELSLKRLGVIYLLRLSLMEGLGLLLLSNSLVLLWLFPVLFALYSLSDLLLGDYYWNRTDVATPLEQSQWSTLATRIEAWARRMNAAVPELYVSESATTFIYETRYSSRRRAPRLYLNTLFLNKSDWRQRDVLIVMALAVLQSDALRRATPQHLWRTVYNTLLIAGLVFGATFIVRFSPTRMVELLGLVDGICLVVMVTRSLFQVMFTLRKKPAPYGKFQRIAAEITGDPLATVVAHHSAHMLRHPHTMDIHLTIVKNFIQRKRPLAPWAAIRVASSEPFDQGMYRLTVPLAQGTAAAPVPIEPYEEGVLDVTTISDPERDVGNEVSSK
jgi:hypothetical protein